MKKWYQQTENYLRKEFRYHPTYYILLTTIFLIAFFLRVYRLGELMGFYYDQGRDALVIWNLWHEHKLFLVGPITGLSGIFLGPLYYYLIAPFYLLGGGNPVVPAYFLAFLATLAIVVVYILGVKLHSRLAGFIAVLISTFSLYIVHAGRWLSNPTPILLTSVLLFWTMWEISDQSKNKFKRNSVLWVLVAVLVGVSLQFESASAVFYLPIIGVFVIWLYLTDRKFLPSVKTTIIALSLLFITFLPQIVFNFRHDNLILNSFKRVFVKEQSFRLSFWEVLGVRLNYFWEVFNSKIIPEKRTFNAMISLIVLFSLFVVKDEKMRKKVLPIFCIFLFVPMLGYIMFQGNFGNIFDYYMTGYYLPLILLFSIGLAEVWKSGLGKFVVIVFFYYFFLVNIQLLRNDFFTKNELTDDVNLSTQLVAVDFILQDGKTEREFNVDFYVPPVIPYAYDYLFLWQGNKMCGSDLCGLQLNKQTEIVYTPYEVDVFHPYRLEEWLEKMESVGKVIEEKEFGGIVVQKRIRF